MRDNRFSYANVGTFRRNLSNASFKLYMRRLSRIFAARRCASDATRRRVFLLEFVEFEPVPVVPLRDDGPRRCDTRPETCDRGQIAYLKEIVIYLRFFLFKKYYFT